VPRKEVALNAAGGAAGPRTLGGGAAGCAAGQAALHPTAQRDASLIRELATVAGAHASLPAQHRGTGEAAVDSCVTGLIDLSLHTAFTSSSGLGRTCIACCHSMPQSCGEVGSQNLTQVKKKKKK
jgi:hypothetical protein